MGETHACTHTAYLVKWLIKTDSESVRADGGVYMRRTVGNIGEVFIRGKAIKSVYVLERKEEIVKRLMCVSGDGE